MATRKDEKPGRKEKNALIDEITELREKYKDTYGVSIFSLPMPDMFHSNLSYVNLRDILIKVINTGENIQDAYYKYIVGSKPTINTFTR